ncbi:MAG: hypothetical protein QOK37_1859 [Thermoanaerobaculia bacterium]|jgi:SAM-dependent methyltransferase|nr:hypothetical protein [Thermoanaerobaculia bacterium]
MAQPHPKLDTDDAIRALRADPKFAALIEDSYLTGDVEGSAQRFHRSAEFRAVLDLIGPVAGKHVLDTGAGNGIASYAFASEGAAVFALEPNLSSEFGARAIQSVCVSRGVCVFAGTGEAIPLREESVDIVYGRQVLHHARHLPAFINECARVLRKGGTFIATREHVADDETQLRKFLHNHAVHRLAGGEHAYPLHTYLDAITAAGLIETRVIGPWESVINAFPTARTEQELQKLPAVLLRRYFGFLGAAAAAIPGVVPLVWKLLRRPRPGRMYALVARRPV